MKIAVLFGLPLLAVATPVLAQDCVLPIRDENDQAHYGCSRRSNLLEDRLTPISIKDIVVTGTLPESKANASYPVTRIYLDNASNRLESALSQAAGLQQFRRSDARSANPTSQGVTLRG
ncbi:MAG: hypothetical protein ABL922_14860, partial [Sphingorhabdus sp.]